MAPRMGRRAGFALLFGIFMASCSSQATREFPIVDLGEPAGKVLLSSDYGCILDWREGKGPAFHPGTCGAYLTRMTNSVP